MPFELGQSIRAQVGSASVAAMELAQPAEAQERTIEMITAEIEQLKAHGGEVIIEIGKRLIEAKERLPHGEWAAWLADRVEFSERTAQEFMKIAREWSNPRTLADLGKSKALKLLLLPAAERDEFLEAHDVPNMSTRELEQAIRERDEARKALQTTEARLADTKRTLTESGNLNTELQQKLAQARADVKAADDEAAENERQLKERIKELESAPKEVYKDEAAIQKAADEARASAEAEWSAKVNELVGELAETRKNAELRGASAQDGHLCVTGLNPHGSCGAASYCTKPYSCCIACPSPCNSYCGFLPETQSEALPNAAPVVSPCWYVGIPPKDGLYYAEFECAGTSLRTPARWDSMMRYWTFNHGAKIGAECRRWWPIPEDE